MRIGVGADAMSSKEERQEIAVPPAPLVDRGYDATGKSLQEIENDIWQTRAGIASILHEIELEHAPQHLLERAIGRLKDGGDGSIAGRIGEAVRDSPLAVMLMGIGIGWFALSAARSGGRHGEYRDPLRQRISGEGKA